MSDPGATLIDRYLNELCWAMGGMLAEQQAVRDELRAHIADAMRERSMGGGDALDALRGVLADLGDPTELGREMRATRSAAAKTRPLVQATGALILAAPHERHLPHPAVIAALAASGATGVAVALVYMWPV